MATTQMRRDREDDLRAAEARETLAKRSADAFARSSVYGGLQAASTMLSWSGRCIRIGLTPPFTWIPDAFEQTVIVFRRTMVPLAVSSVVYVLTYATIMAGEFLLALGVSDRYGAAITTGDVREVATWVTMMVLAGVAGSAITADLGARRIREELDALDVLGVDTVRYLVLPRVVGVTFAALVLPMICVLFCVVLMNLFVAPSRFGIDVPVLLNGMGHSLTAPDLIATELKYLVIGFFIGIVACERGLTCKRGAEGVGRAVNQSVVITFFGLWLINSFWNTGYLSFFPQATSLRG